MTPHDAVTRPDAWKPIPWGRKWRVAQILADGTRLWHVGRSLRVGGPGRPILFTHLDNAMARAGALNLADMRRINVAEAKAVTP